MSIALLQSSSPRESLSCKVPLHFNRSLQILSPSVSPLCTAPLPCQPLTYRISFGNVSWLWSISFSDWLLVHCASRSKIFFLSTLWFLSTYVLLTTGFDEPASRNDSWNQTRAMSNSRNAAWLAYIMHKESIEQILGTKSVSQNRFSFASSRHLFHKWSTSSIPWNFYEIWPPVSGDYREIVKFSNSWKKCRSEEEVHSHFKQLRDFWVISPSVAITRFY